MQGFREAGDETMNDGHDMTKFIAISLAQCQKNKHSVLNPKCIPTHTMTHIKYIMPIDMQVSKHSSKRGN